ncbi:MAG: hypothetical protein ACRDU5_15830 [Mycobacterium sp.]
MSTTYDTDASTIAAAWASSPLGDPISGPTELWETVEHAEAPPPAKPTSLARHAAIVAALAAGIGAGAAFGLAVFDFNEPAQSSVAVPVVSAPAGGPTGAGQAVPPKEAAVAPAAPPKHVEPAAPKPVVTAPKPAQAAVSAAPKGPVDPGTAPASHPPVIVDIDIPPLPPWPEQPEQPKPDPADPGPKPTLQIKSAEEPTLQQAPPQTMTTLPPQPKPALATPGPQNVGPSLDQAMETQP